MVTEFERLRRLAPAGPALKASVPGPYTLSGRLTRNGQYPDRWAVTEALVPIVRDELQVLCGAGCREITVDEPSMSCYAHREDPRRFVEIFRRTVESVIGRARLSTHLCFGNYKGRAVGPRRYRPMFPVFLELPVPPGDRRGIRGRGQPACVYRPGRKTSAPRVRMSTIAYIAGP